MRIGRRITPAFALFFLSPAIGELLSGSSPPARFFNPAGFVLLSVLFYAAGMPTSSGLSTAITGQFPQPVPYPLLRELTIDYGGTSVVGVVPAA